MPCPGHRCDGKLAEMRLKRNQKARGRTAAASANSPKGLTEALRRGAPGTEHPIGSLL